MADAGIWLCRASAVTPHHEDVIAFCRKGSIGLGNDSLVNGPLRIVGGDFDTDLLSSGGNYFNSGLPVRPAVRACGDVAKLLSVVFAPAVSIGVLDSSIVEEFLGAVNIIASPLQVSNSSLIIEGLLTRSRVHQRARNLIECCGLVGHGVGDDRRIVHRNSDSLADCDLVQTGGIQVVEGSRKTGTDAIRSLGQVGGDGK